MELAEQRYQHWCAQKTLDPELRQELAAMQNDADKITDAFYRDLEFGTAGLRGVLGAGTNRMNIYPPRDAGGRRLSQRDGPAEDRRHRP